jgi:hypothetical protein
MHIFISKREMCTGDIVCIMSMVKEVGRGYSFQRFCNETAHLSEYVVATFDLYSVFGNSSIRQFAFVYSSFDIPTRLLKPV